MTRKLEMQPVMTLGEARARWREEHLCLRCLHHQVCKMAAALDPNFLAAISQCAAFDPAEKGDERL